MSLIVFICYSQNTSLRVLSSVNIVKSLRRDISPFDSVEESIECFWLVFILTKAPPKWISAFESMNQITRSLFTKRLPYCSTYVLVCLRISIVTIRGVCDYLVIRVIQIRMWIQQFLRMPPVFQNPFPPSLNTAAINRSLCHLAFDKVICVLKLKCPKLLLQFIRFETTRNRMKKKKLKTPHTQNMHWHKHAFNVPAH